MKSAKQYYGQLGVKGLAKRKLSRHTRLELSYLQKQISKKDKILDLACGYGRFTIPLAKKGYEIEGVDISQNLIKAAKQKARQEKVKIKFLLGDMRKLPYPDDYFSVIICMWSAFTELITKQDQIKSLREMLRILQKDGFAIIEMPIISKKIIAKNPELSLAKNNIINMSIDCIKCNPHYGHTKKTLTALMNLVEPSKYTVYPDIFGGRKRLFLKFWK
jgi:ubiquinone/menaquinone biosynthesis C-methylase UbiE